MIKNKNDYDVIILGGGVAGCATALSLRHRGIEKILIVEADDYKQIRIGESLPPDACQLLNQLGLWTDFLKEGHEACLGSCSSWGDDALGYNDFLCNPYGNGWHLDRRRFDAFIARKTVESGIRFQTHTRFIDASPLKMGGFSLRFHTENNTQQNITSRFVVDATGKIGRFARQQGAKRLFVDQLAFISVFCDKPKTNTFPQLTYLEAVEQGWWYAASLPDNQLVISMATEPETLRAQGLLHIQEWLKQLYNTRHLAQQLEGCQFKNENLIISVAPSFQLNKTSGKDWLAVGDAASCYDPISSQGIYKALSDGVHAAQSITDYLNLKEESALDNYHFFISHCFDDYLNNRNYFYQLENRWSTSHFWRNRQTRTALPI